MSNCHCEAAEGGRSNLRAWRLLRRPALWAGLLAMTAPVLSLPSLFALEIPPQPEGRVSDYAGMLSPAKRAELEELLQQFEAETTNQIVVATFSSLEGEVLEDFSIRLAEAWKIGQAGKDNGVILLIFKADRQVRIEVGYGLEGALPDATCKLIIENEIVPRFREGKFDEGVVVAVQAIIAATKGEYRAKPARVPVEADSLISVLLSGAFLGAVLPLLILWVLFSAGLGFGFLALVFKSYAIALYAFLLGGVPLAVYFLTARHRRGPLILTSRGSRPRGSRVSWGGGGWSGGGSFGGGFSGGGGSFGGGGASGRW